MTGLVDLTKSERGVIAILVIVCATVLLFMGRIDADHWVAIVKWTVIITVAGKTLRSSNPADPDPDPSQPLPEARTVQGSTEKV